jgi:type IV pilus assembly protein PilE
MRPSLRPASRAPQHGFTLIELMIVVAVVAILARIAYPSYADYVVRGKLSEAVAQLSAMRIKLEQYFQDNRTYVGACVSGTVAPLPGVADSKYFSYACSTLSSTEFKVTATGLQSQGLSDGANSFIYTIDQDGNRVTTSTKWGTCANTACWVLRRDCSC